MKDNRFATIATTHEDISERNNPPTTSFVWLHIQDQDRVCQQNYNVYYKTTGSGIITRKMMNQQKLRSSGEFRETNNTVSSNHFCSSTNIILSSGQNDSSYFLNRFDDEVAYNGKSKSNYNQHQQRNTCSKSMRALVAQYRWSLCQAIFT